MKIGELRIKGSIGLEGTCRHHQIFFLDKTIPSRSLSQVPLRIPCAFTTSMALWCLSQPGAHLHPRLNGDLRTLALPVAFFLFRVITVFPFSSYSTTEGSFNNCQKVREILLSEHCLPDPKPSGWICCAPCPNQPWYLQ